MAAMLDSQLEPGEVSHSTESGAGVREEREKAENYVEQHASSVLSGHTPTGPGPALFSLLVLSSNMFSQNFQNGVRFGSVNYRNTFCSIRFLISQLVNLDIIWSCYDSD